jgi:hypothetical protein
MLMALVIMNTGAFAQESYIPELTKEQRKKQSELAKKAIKDLKEGVMVVRVPCNYNKIINLEKLIATTEGARKSRFSRMLERTIAETQSEANQVMSAFESFYTFSEVLFIYDTAAVALKNGRQSGIFLDKSLKIDPAISLNNRPFLIFKKNPFQDFWTVGDATIRDIGKPFPYKTPYRQVLIFRIPISAVVAYLNTKLSAYYLLVN